MTTQSQGYIQVYVDRITVPAREAIARYGEVRNMAGKILIGIDMEQGRAIGLTIDRIGTEARYLASNDHPDDATSHIVRGDLGLRLAIEPEYPGTRKSSTIP